MPVFGTSTSQIKKKVPYAKTRALQKSTWLPVSETPRISETPNPPARLCWAPLSGT